HQAIKRADLILAVCPLIAERASLSVDSYRVHLTPDVAFDPVVSSGQAIENLHDLCPHPGPLSLYVGNLEPYQGIDLLLEAMTQIEPDKRGSLLIIGGTADSIAVYQVKTEHLGLQGHVRFLGQRPLNALHSYLQQADILCSPRLKGVNTPMKIYSYMLSGRAILATDISSHSQVLDNSRALLVDADPDKLSEGWQRLIASPELREVLGTRASSHAAMHYSEKSFYDRLSQAYAVLDDQTLALTGISA
ncbi:MAG: glycosyltransferase family 4 protein, partial [Nitrosomonadales bacterium]|nr:glycosyltransferase family 4 protein [Nitrosomonadales bacterium]